MLAFVICLARSISLSSAFNDAGSCIDDQEYVSKLGLGCSHHLSLKCDGFGKLGFSEQEVAELKAKCPVSCGVPPCVKPELIEGKGRTYQKTIATSDAELVDTQKARVLQEDSCYPGWPQTCQDNFAYRSRLGLDCSMHIVVDCKVMQEIGFSESEIDELILNCPCSCGVECG